MHKTTLEQWALLEKVVATGSFARAAEATHRSQSSVSYNLALLQEHLGVALLVPEGRRAVLTPAGELLLNQVKPLLQAFSWLETRAATLQNGTRTRLDLVVDSIFPRRRLFAILKQFQQAWPQTQVRLTEVLENSAEEQTAYADADVMVLTRRQDVTGRGEWLMNIDFVAVAHCDHPLCGQDALLDEEALRAWPLIRIADRDNPQQPARDAWTFSTIDAAIDAVMYQVGYGWLPEERIAPLLEQGILRTLPLAHGARRATPLHLIVKNSLAPLDEQVSTLLRLLRER
ncbi:LysR family transcriptional regulator [Citrobacter rodentium]|uniref:LysR-family transcriptional regulator n=2 Tax=Citrobacter rodentium TaxID=67825 RepID=D2TKQ5_CITRI|nr:LysR family transcriptional regulator [Citrobacter rodentium]KIQ50106.1 LysR family transcriptional regulator [Citrobacter rodentium]QBY30598.1 LysR family transcriptional regulator [Citrobacter rodentium]UHO32032.1 LysR family transcriptional regulator [Citrobacter rodentium NBRC 105723 = DSM 16636]CBG91019.1 LysR-family transcriptional regulator [Citrobacter rodentium ICC168]HAT8011353.1 LysR family transcriptional regulator [Citrobacter rodentium NBRC 105723 = DSM 16636]